MTKLQSFKSLDAKKFARTLPASGRIDADRPLTRDQIRNETGQQPSAPDPKGEFIKQTDRIREKRPYRHPALTADSLGWRW